MLFRIVICLLFYNCINRLIDNKINVLKICYIKKNNKKIRMVKVYIENFI